VCEKYIFIWSSEIDLSSVNENNRSCGYLLGGGE
jgi:hypothetical protein